MTTIFRTKCAPITIADLLYYPDGTMGFQLGKYLRTHYKNGPAPEIEDVFRLLLTTDNSNKEEIGMHCYLAGNGDTGLRRLGIMLVGLLCYPHLASHFLKRYRDGRRAFRFYDLDHFRMLHLPVSQIKDAFLIR